MATIKPKRIPPKKELHPLTFYGVKFRFTNFQGKADKFNAEGARNFHVVLDESQKDIALKQGYSIRELEGRDEGEPSTFLLRVKLRFDNFPPRIHTLTDKTKIENMLGEENVHLLDWAEVGNVDLTISPYRWEMATGSEGVTAYLKTMWVTIIEDELDVKYSNIKTDQIVPELVDEVPAG